MASIVHFDPPLVRVGRPELAVHGYLLRADSPKGKPLTLVVGAKDYDRITGLTGQESYTVTDLWQNRTYKVARADCGAGCRCALTAKLLN